MSDDFSDGAPTPEECYRSLGIEMSGTDHLGNPITWQESDWDATYVRLARIHAEAEDLPFPPEPIQTGWMVTIHTTREGA